MLWAFAQSYEHPTMVFIFASTFEFDRVWEFCLVILLCQSKSLILSMMMVVALSVPFLARKLARPYILQLDGEEKTENNSITSLLPC